MNFSAGYVGDSTDQMKIRRFEKQREERRQQIEELKKISYSSIAGVGTRQFSTSKSSILEQKFGEETVGLVSRAEFIEKRRTLEERLQMQKQQRCKQEEEFRYKSNIDQRLFDKELAKSKLSFLEDECEDNETRPADFYNRSPASKKIKVFKNPDLDTSFLPDRESKKEKDKKIHRLEYNWKIKQEEIKKEPLDIIYSYWDGTGHRRKIAVRKGDTIGNFLSVVQRQLSSDFKEIRTTSSGSLIYVKEDIILPHHHTFYELIINKARGKSGPLFDFGVKEDIRIQNDATIERDESHAGKVVERHWYEKNKHIFPASRWEVHNPVKKWGKYTLHDCSYNDKIR